MGGLMFLIPLALIGVVIVWAIGMYNGLVRIRNAVKNAWSQIDVQLKRRHDLIPNLVETVKGYAGHEKKTLEGVIQARSAAVSANGVEAQAKAEQGLSGALGRLMLLAESYPDLKANQNFLSLQEELTSTENKISFARQAYNDSVTVYNTAIETFPNSMIAGATGFQAAQLFQVEVAAEREPVKVSFDS